MGEIAARFDEKNSELAGVNEVPQVVPLNPAPAPAAEPVRQKLKAPSATGRSVNSAKYSPSVQVRDRAIRRRGQVPSAAYASLGKFPIERIVVPTRAGASIPRGYTMVLVDYPPVTSSKRTPVSSSKRAKEISTPRKRSYLARALPALVRKPWNLIKSIASKLD